MRADLALVAENDRADPETVEGAELLHHRVDSLVGNAGHEGRSGLSGGGASGCEAGTWIVLMGIGLF